MKKAINIREKEKGLFLCFQIDVTYTKFKKKKGLFNDIQEVVDLVSSLRNHEAHVLIDLNFKLPSIPTLKTIRGELFCFTSNCGTKVFSNTRNFFSNNSRGTFTPENITVLEDAIKNSQPFRPSIPLPVQNGEKIQKTTAKCTICGSNKIVDSNQIHNLPSDFTCRDAFNYNTGCKNVAKCKK